ncbi:Zn-dependent hydrolase [Edaphobacillus lindanitolerans]|uniref:Allantoate deiminase n=1 Tax=Edaphobacillus lindanitolerans TaxID=550447 RepID=A0A1U7PKU2_9BACI|nr:Zn-dependent hydrolase [Edaphobacillus lindanitolerans]SIT72079.1 allantoate deiminase [Edaphobacillus lindanitolerans]
MGKHSLKEKLLAGYDGALDKDGISGRRLAERLAALSEIGRTGDGGVNRPGFSDKEKEAKRQVMEWLEEAGFEVRHDGAGNVIGRLKGESDAPAFAAGSHVDSVPNGGNFDGPLGVLSALEVAEAWKDTGFVPQVPYEVIIFSEEEGSRFGAGILGSQAMTGDLDREKVEGLSDKEGRAFAEVVEAYGSSVDNFLGAARNLGEIGFYAEVHIEQGKLLEAADLPAGIVKGIAGPAWLDVAFHGSAGHAGNTPMAGRRDPLVAAGRFVSEVSSLPALFSETAVATVGRMNVSPNGTNVIPEQVELTVDIRDLDKETRDGLVGKVRETAERCAADCGVNVDIRLASSIDPVPVKEDVRAELREVFGEMDLNPMELMSGAGHDAMILGRHVPMAMIFVQSKDGVSHNPAEWSDLSDCLHGVHLLKKFAERQMEKIAGE